LVLGRSGFASACVDTSDGLKGALEALAERSDVGFVIDESRVPVLPDVAVVSKMIGVPALELVFGDSVDFQLLFTVAPGNLAALTDSFEAVGLRMAAIGVASSSREICIHDGDGKMRPVPGKPWRHASEIVATPG
jgi:thiamine-monophosphate kinase